MMKEKDPSKISWKQMFLFTRDGNLQNMDLMYAFFLGIALLFVNFIAGNRLTILFERLFPAFSRIAKNVLGILFPALISALIAFLLFRAIRRKKVVLMACCTALLITVVFVLAILFMYDRETAAELLPPFIGIFVAPNLSAVITSALLYREWSIRNPDPIREEERELAARDSEESSR